MNPAGSTACMTRVECQKSRTVFTEAWRSASVVFCVLLFLRGLAIFTGYFYQVDEVSLAAGAAALVRGNVARLYNYTPQIGYYRLVELIDRLLGSRVIFIPFIIKGLSAIAGAAIPTLALFA